MPNKHFHLSVEELLKKVQDGKLEIKDAIYKLKCLPYEDLGFAKTDGHRVLRQGFPEVIFLRK